MHHPLRLETSYELRTDSGSFSIRVNIAGTNWPWVTPVALDGVQGAFGVELLHHDRRMPAACTLIDHTDGAVWYSGAGLR